MYLAAALEEADEPGGQEALLLALRHVAEAQGMAKVAERAGLPRESSTRAWFVKGNPTENLAGGAQRRWPAPIRHS